MMSGKYEELLEQCRGLDPIPTAVAHPCEATALAGALEARDEGLIVPILVGPRAKIREVADKAKVTLDGIEIIDAPHSHESAARAVALVREAKQSC
jgi:phosphate acetyltransferase